MQAATPEVAAYVGICRKLRLANFSGSLLHILLLVLAWAMALTTPTKGLTKGEASPARILFAVVMLVPTGLALYRAFDCNNVWERIQSTQDLPTYDWHDKAFSIASINVWIATMCLWLGIFLFLFHQAGEEIINVLQMAFKQSILAAGLVILAFFFILTCLVYVYSFKYIPGVLERFDSAEEEGEADEGVDINGNDKMLVGATLLCNIGFTAGLFVLGVYSGNSAAYISIALSTLILLAITAKGFGILKTGRFQEHFVLQYASVLMFHLWLNAIMFNFVIGVSLLVFLGKPEDKGFFNSVGELGANQLMIWLSLVGFFLMMGVYTVQLTLHKSGMWAADEIDNARLMTEVVGDTPQANPAAEA